MKEEKICKWCGKIYSSRGAKYFCSRECYNHYHSQENYQKYLDDNSIAYGFKNMQNYKKYFLEDQNHKCAICGIEDTWNNQKLVLILDHINGNADDNARENLRLVCPNCDSQLDTYKAKNKNSARRKYRKC